MAEMVPPAGNPRGYIAAGSTVPGVLSVACTVPLVTVPVLVGETALAEELLASTAATQLTTMTAPSKASSTLLPVIHLVLVAVPSPLDRTLTNAHRGTTSRPRMTLVGHRGTSSTDHAGSTVRFIKRSAWENDSRHS